MNPRHILLIKSHSMGIGDLLRSSAAWQALHQRWPEARLYLLMLSRHPGYPTEALIGEHHLLTRAVFVAVATDPADPRKRATAAVRAEIAQRLGDVPLDCVIDCEPHGLRTTLLARWIGRRWGAPTVGIAQFPTRGWWYTHAAPSTRDYVQHHGLPLPMDYTERDFVALAALGIARAGQPIVLQVTAAGAVWQQTHLAHAATRPRLTLNIGCGTADALPKRPDLDALIACLLALLRRWPFELHLSGAAFEREVNAEFARRFAIALAACGLVCPVFDWAGQGSLSELTGLLGASDLVVSSDSGPYHMAVALGIPTVCWFNFATPASLHRQIGVRDLIAPTPEAFVDASVGALHALRGRCPP